MGSNSSTDLHVGTLNFSGICLSPFEYHDLTVQKDIISQKFQSVVDQYCKKYQQKKQPNKKTRRQWNLGDIDKNIQKQRYAPIYNKQAGVNSKDQLMNKKQFNEAWDEMKDKWNKKYSFKQQHIQQTKLFDWLCYLTLVNVANDLQQTCIEQQFKDKGSQKYKLLMKKWHSMPYLNNNKKIKMVVECLINMNLDVLCLQQIQTEQDKIKQWQNRLDNLQQKYQFFYDKQKNNSSSSNDKNITSAIIVKKQTFPTQSSQDLTFQSKYQKILNFNNDSKMVKLGEYLIISGHLSSNKQKNRNQAKYMFEQLYKITQKHKQIKLIVGLDSNHFLDPIYNKFNIVPDDERQYTSIKKRTTMQPQTKKANLIVQQNKDQIFTNLFIQHHSILSINNKSVIQTKYLPYQQHPFDHYLVYARIQNNLIDNEKYS